MLFCPKKIKQENNPKICFAPFKIKPMKLELAMVSQDILADRDSIYILKLSKVHQISVSIKPSFKCQSSAVFLP